MSTEFVKQTLRENLTRILVPHIADGLWSIYDNAKSACERNGQPEKTLQTFQNLLTSVSKWKDETLAKEVERIVTASKCDYLDDLLLGVFVSYIRAFSSLRQSEEMQVNIEFEHPSLSKFIQAMYTAAARKSWAQAYLFNTINVASTQQARNRRDIEAMLEATVGEVIDGFIPWREISKAYFKAGAPPAAAPAPSPVTFAPPEVHEFETDNEEDSDDEERPKIALGEDIKLSDDEEEEVDTDTELEQMATETVALNL